MRKLLMAVVGFAMLSASATDWSVFLKGGERYYADAPYEGYVWLGEDDSPYLVTDEDFDTFNQITHINLNTDNVVIEFRLNNDHTLNCAVRDMGRIVKTGSGTLTLNSSLARQSFGYVEDFCSSYFDILEGTVVMAQNKGWHCRYGVVTIAAGAVVQLANDANTMFDGLNGEGSIYKDDVDSSDSYKSFWLVIGNPDPAGRKTVSNFSGLISGHEIQVIAGREVNLTGTANEFQRGAAARNGGVLGLKKFGANFEEPSSAGSGLTSGQNITIQSYGTVKYIGGEEDVGEVGKGFAPGQEAGQPEPAIDGGDFGGFTWRGQWFYDPNGCFGRLTLKGENILPCTMAGPVKWESVANGMNFYITKDGSGTWCFADNNDRTKMCGPLWVKNGKLQYTSLANTGVICSLGMSTLLYDAPCGAVKDGEKYKVDYAFLIGGGENPVFEFAGANNNSSDRKIAITGEKATIAYGDDATGSIRLTGGVKALDAGEHELHLRAGEYVTVEENRAIVGDIEDGEGKVSVVKEGPGVFTLGGKATFTGDLKVTEGKAIVAGCKEAEPYQWYRWTILETQRANDSGATVEAFVKRLGLFDKDGNAIGFNLEEVMPDDWVGEKAYFTADQFHWQNLRPGQCTLGDFGENQKAEIHNGNSVARLFDLSSECFRCEVLLVDNSIPSPSHIKEGEKSLPIVFRLPEGSKPVAYYDVLAHINHEGPNDNHVAKWKFEASIDGINWDELHRVSECPGRNEAYWASTGVQSPRNESTGNHEDQNCVAAGFGYAISTSKGGQLAEMAGGEIVEVEPFTWYRLTIMGSKTAEDGDFTNGIHIQALALFDEDGDCVTKNLEEVLPDGASDDTYIQASDVWMNLDYGQCAIGRIIQPDTWKAGWEYHSGMPLANIFKLKSSWSGMFRSETVPAAGNGTELEIVLRPPAETKPIKYFDLMSSYDHDLSETSSDHITAFKLEGSVDGEAWVEIKRVTKCPARAKETWYSTGVKPTVGEDNDFGDLNCKTAGFGYEIAAGVEHISYSSSTQMASVRSVQVDQGAEIAADGEIAAIKSIKIDGDIGGGTFNGFKFADAGVIDITTEAPSAYTSFEAINAEGLDNLKNWTLKINGKDVDNGSVMVEDGYVTVEATAAAPAKAGTVILFR